MAITSAINNNKQKRLTPTSNPMWFNIYYMAITSGNNHVSTHNGITSAIFHNNQNIEIKYYRHVYKSIPA